MDRTRLQEVISALNERNVNQSCPRCSSNKFSVVGESEITVTMPPPPSGLGAISGLTLHPVKTTMPTIIVTCDNCGFVSHHAQASLGLFKPRSPLSGLR